MNALAIFVGGGIGSLCRYGIFLLFGRFATKLPWSTILTNVLSCIIIAILVSKMEEEWVHQPFFKALLIVGFCGGFSTFSTFGLETYYLIKNGLLTYAIINVLISTLLGVGLILMVLRNT